MSSALSPPKVASSSKQFEIQQKKLRELESDVREYQASISRLELEKAELRKQNVALSAGEGKRSALESRLFSLREELELEKKKSAAEAASAQRTKADAEGVIAKWQEAETGWVSENAQLQESVRRLTSVESTLRSEVDHLKAKVAQDRREANARETDIADLHASLNELRKFHETANCENQALGSRLNESVAEKARQREQMEELTRENAKLKHAKAKFEQDIVSLEGHLEQRNHLVNSLRSENSDLENLRDELTSQRNKLSSRCDFLAEEAKTLHEKLSVLDINFQDAQNAILYRDRTTSEFVAERVQLNAQLEECKETVVRLTAANQQHQRQLEESTREATDLSGKLTLLRAEHQALHSTCAQLEEQLTEHKLLICDLKEENTTLLATRETADHQRTHLIENLDNVSAERAHVQSELGARLAELELVQGVQRRLEHRFLFEEECCERLSLEQECHLTWGSEERIHWQRVVANARALATEASRLHHDAVQDLASATARIDTLNASSAALMNDLTASQTQCAHFEDDNKSMKLALATLQEQSAAVGETAAQHEQQLAALATEMSTLRDENTMLKQSADAAVNAARQEVRNDAEQRIKAVEAMASKERDEMRNKFNKERDSVMVLRGKLTAADAKAGELSEQVAHCEREIEASKALCKSLEASIAELTKKNERLKLHVNNHKMEADNAIENKQKYKDEFVELLAAYNQAVDANQSIQAHLKETVGRAKSEFARLKAVHVDARDKLEAVLKKVRADRNARRAAQPEFEQAVVALDQLSTVLSEKEPTFDAVKTAVEGKTHPSSSSSSSSSDPQRHHLQQAPGGVNRPAPMKRPRTEESEAAPH